MEELVGVGVVINSIMVLLMAEVDMEVDIPRAMDKAWYSLAEQRLKQDLVEKDHIVAVVVVVELSYRDRNRELRILMELVMVLEVVLEVVFLELFL